MVFETWTVENASVVPNTVHKWKVKGEELEFASGMINFFAWGCRSCAEATARVGQIDKRDAALKQRLEAEAGKPLPSGPDEQLPPTARPGGGQKKPRKSKAQGR